MNTTYPNTTQIVEQTVFDRRQKITWGAVLAGMLLSLMVYLVLSILGTAIGASAIDPLGEANPFEGFGTGIGIWAISTTLISIAVGAFTAGYLARRTGMLHGLLSWSLTTLITVYVLAAMTNGVFGSAASVAKTGISAAGQVAGAGMSTAAPIVKDKLAELGISLDSQSLKNELEKLLQQTGKPELDPKNIENQAKQTNQDAEQSAKAAITNPNSADEELTAWFSRVLSKNDSILDATDKEALVNIIIAKTGKNHAEAEDIANQYQALYNKSITELQATKVKAEQKAREGGAIAADKVAKGSWGILAVLILGAILSALLGGLGYRIQDRRYVLLRTQRVNLNPA